MLPKSLILAFVTSLLVLTSCASSNTDTGTQASSSSTAFSSPYGLPGDKAYPQFAKTRPATGNKVIIVDPNIPAWGAYDAEGNLVMTGEASPGRKYCADLKRGCKTPAGTYKIYSKKGPECVSSRFPLSTHGGAPMPYCMHFYKGYALHGSNVVVPYNASHGCVRMQPSSAEWLSKNFAKIGTTVIILPYGKNAPFGE